MNMDIKKIESITLDDIEKAASNCNSESEIVLILCYGVSRLEPEIMKTMSPILYRFVRRLTKLKNNIIYGNQNIKEIYISLKNNKETTLSNIIMCANTLRIISNTKYGLSTE